MAVELDEPRIDLETAEQLAHVVYVVLLPLAAFTGTVDYGLVSIPPFEPVLWALNSLLWGIALYYVGGWLYRRWRGRRRPAH